MTSLNHVKQQLGRCLSCKRHGCLCHCLFLKQFVHSTEQAYAAYTASRAATKQGLQDSDTVDAAVMPSSAMDTWSLCSSERSFGLESSRASINSTLSRSLFVLVLCNLHYVYMHSLFFLLADHGLLQHWPNAISIGLLAYISTLYHYWDQALVFCTFPSFCFLPSSVSIHVLSLAHTCPTIMHTNTQPSMCLCQSVIVNPSAALSEFFTTQYTAH